MTNAFRSLWRHRDYRFFFGSFFLGNIGDWFDFFALQIIFAHKFGGSAEDILNMLAAYVLPMILLASFAGSITDKFDKKWIMAVTDFIAGVLTVALIYVPGIPTALALIAVRSCVIAFNSPAQKAASKLLLPLDLQLQASSYENIAFHMCRIIGPMLGAVVVALASAEACLGINAISFFLSTLLLLFLKPITGRIEATEEEKSEPKQDEEKMSNWRLTYRFVMHNPLLKYLVPLILLGSMLIMMVELQLVILLKDIVPSKPDLLGYVVGFSAVGSVITGGWLSRKQHIVKFGAYLILCYLCAAAGFFIMSRYQVAWPVAVFLFAALLSGLGLGILFVLQTYAIKKEAPDHQMGRISGVLSMVQGIAFFVGVYFGANLITTIGAREAFMAVSMSCLVLGLASLVLYRGLTVKS